MSILHNRYGLAVISALLVVGTSSSSHSAAGRAPVGNLALDRDQDMLESGYSVGCLRSGVESSCRMIDTIAVEYGAVGSTPFQGPMDAPDYHSLRSVSRGPTYVALFKQSAPADGIPRIRSTEPRVEYENGRPIIFSAKPAEAKAGVCGRNMIVVEVVDYARSFKSSDCPGEGG